MVAFLDNIWSWILGIIGQIVAKVIRYIWNWVEAKVREKWSELKPQSGAFKQAFALGMFGRKLKENEDHVRSQLSPDDQSRLEDLMDQT